MDAFTAYVQREQEKRQLRKMASQNTGIPVADERIRQADTSQLIQALPKSRQLPITPEQQAQIGLSQGYAPQPVQPVQQPVRNPSLLNPVIDIAKGTYNAVQNAPQMIADMVKSGAENFTTAEGLGHTLPAFGRGVVKGTLDLPSGMAGLVASGINSVAGKELIPMDSENVNFAPASYALEQIKEKMDMQKRLQTPVIRPDARIGVAGDNYVYNGKTPGALSQYLVGADQGADKAQFSETTGELLAPTGLAGNVIKGVKAASTASKLKKAENLQKTIEATKVAEQKSKYAKQLEKLKQAEEKAKKQNEFLNKLKSNTISAALVGSTEGNTLEEKASNAASFAALSAGGSLLHAGTGKAMNSKPVKSVTGKIADRTNEYLDKHHKAAKFAGTVSDVMNTDISSPLAKKYQGLNKLVSQNLNITKHLTREERDIWNSIQDLPEDVQKTAVDYLKKGEARRAEDLVKKARYDINNRMKNGEKVSSKEQAQQSQNEIDAIKDKINTEFKQKQNKASESNLREVKQEKGTNTPEEVKTPVKTQSESSEHVPQKNAEGTYELKAELNEKVKQKSTSELLKDADEKHNFVQDEIKRMDREEAERNAKYANEAKERQEKWKQLKNSESKQKNVDEEVMEYLEEIEGERYEDFLGDDFVASIREKGGSVKDILKKRKKAEQIINIKNAKRKEIRELQNDIRNITNDINRMYNNPNNLSEFIFKGKSRIQNLENKRKEYTQRLKKLKSEYKTGNINDIIDTYLTREEGDRWNLKNREFGLDPNHVNMSEVYKNAHEYLQSKENKSVGEIEQKAPKNKNVEERKTIDEMLNEQLSKSEKYGTTQQGKTEVTKDVTRYSKIKEPEKYDHYDDVPEGKKTTLDPGDAETMPLNKRTKNITDKNGNIIREDIFADTRAANRQLAYDFANKKDALRDIVFFDAYSHKRVKGIDDGSGQIKENLGVVGKPLINKNGKIAYRVRQLTPEEQAIRKAELAKNAESYNDSMEQTDYDEFKANQQSDYQQSFDDLIDDQNLSENVRMNDEYEKAYEDKVDNFNTNRNNEHIPTGFSIEENPNKSLYSKEMSSELPNGKNADMVKKFNIFYETFKKLNENPKAQTEFVKETYKKLTEDEAEYFQNKLAEIIEEELNAARPREIGESSEKYDNLKNIEKNIFKNLKFMVKEGSRYKVNVDSITEAKINNVLTQAVKDYRAKEVNEAAKGKKYSSYKLEENRKDILKGITEDNIQEQIESIFKNAEDKQTAYEGLVDRINKNWNTSVRINAKRILNKIAKKYDVNTKSAYGRAFTSFESDIEALDAATKRNDVQTIKKIFSKYAHKMHKHYLTEKQREIIHEAYFARSSEFVNEFRNYKQTAKSKFDSYVKTQEEKGYQINKSLERFEAEELRRLSKEREKLQRIINNSFTDWSFENKERYAYNRETDKYEATGDVWNPLESGVHEQEFVKINKELDDIIRKNSDAMLINKFYREGSTTYKPLPKKLVETYKLNSDDSFAEVDKLYEKRKELDKKLSDLQKQYKETENNRYENKDFRRKLEKEINDIKERIQSNEELREIINNHREIDKIVEEGVDIDAVNSEIARIKSDDFKPNIEDLNDVQSHFSIDDYLDYKKILNKKAKGQALTKTQLDQYKDLIDGVRDFKMDVLQKAYRSEILKNKYKIKNQFEQERETKDKNGTQAYGIAKTTIEKGIDISEKLKEVPEGYENQFIDGILKYGGVKKALDAIGYIKNAVDDAGNQLRNGFNNAIEAYRVQNGKKVNPNAYSAIVKPANIVFELVKKEDWNKKISGNFTYGDLAAILNYNSKTDVALTNKDVYKIPEGHKGVTTKDGRIFVEPKDYSEFVSVTAHEFVHNFINNANPELVRKVTGITEADRANSIRANKNYRDFLKSEKGERLNELDKKRKLTEEEKIEFDELQKEQDKLFDEIKQTPEEKLTYDVENAIKEIYDAEKKNPDRQGNRGDKTETQGTERVHDEVSHGPAGVQHRRLSSVRERGEEGLETTRSSENESFASGDTNTPVDIKTFNKKHPGVDEKLNELNLSEKTKDAVIRTIDLGDNFVSSLRNPEETFKTYKELKAIPETVKGATDLITKYAKNVEEGLIKRGIFTAERAANALKKFDVSGQGIYLATKRSAKNKAKISQDKLHNRAAMLGTKTTYGKQATLPEVMWGTLARNLRYEHTEKIVSFLEDNFGEAQKRGKSHPENYVPVNSNILFATKFFGFSKEFYDTLGKGKKAIKDTFGDDAPEILDLVERNNKPNMYIPKEALNMIFDNRETFNEYYNRYVKGKKNKKVFGLIKHGIGKLTDFYNDQFKKGVLATGSFTVNNRGNQFLLMDMADNPGDYFKGLYEAAKLKDSDIPSELVDSSLLHAEAYLTDGKRTYFDNKVDNFLNLMNGVNIDTTSLKGIKKLAANAANIGIGFPNKIYNHVVDFMMKVNEKAEKFERKQAYSQTLSKLKRENVLTVAQKATAVGEFYKHLEEAPELRDYVVRKVQDVLGDYENFNSIEKNLFKRLVPFYSWYRTMYRHTTHLVKENPTMAAIIALKLYKMTHRDNNREDWQTAALDNILGIKLQPGFVSNKISANPYMTVSESLNKAKSLVTGNNDDTNVINDLTPLLKISSEVIHGKKSFAPASEILDPNWKRVTKDGKTGYFNKNSGKFVEGTPASLRGRYAQRELVTNTMYPALKNNMFKGLGTALTSGKGRFPDKMYDTTLGGFYDGDYIGKFDGKRKYRSARNVLPFKYQVANKFGAGIQVDTASQKLSSSDSKKLKKKQQNYKNKRKK